MKNSNKGFTLLETLIVTTFVVTTLIYLFIQLSNIKVNYDITFRYNTVPGVYNALNISDYIISEGYENMSNGLSIGNKLYYSITDNTYIDGGSSTYYSNLVSKINAKKIIFTDENVTKLNEYLASNTVTESDKAVFDEELTKFIKKIDFDGIAGVYRVIIEYNDNTFASVKLGDGSIVSLNEWQTWIYLGGYKVSDYATLDAFLSDTTRATAIFNNSAANDYLLLHTALIDSVKAQTNYVSSLASLLLDSADLTNVEKYNAGLPFYVFNNGVTSITGWTSYFKTSGIVRTHGFGVATNLYTSLTFQPEECALQRGGTATAINFANYKYLNAYANVVDANYPTGVTLGISNTAPNSENVILSSTKLALGLNSLDMGTYKSSYFITFNAAACGGGATVYSNVASVTKMWLY